MSVYLGDFPTGATVEFNWNAFSGLGGSITRATNGSILIYKGHSLTQRSSAAGITDTEDFDGLTGLNHVQIDLSDNTDAGFYAAGNEYAVVLQGAVIDSQTVNAVLAHFSIARASALLGTPAGASIAADIAAIKSDTGSVKTQTDKLAFTVTNQVDANVLDWKSSAAPAMTGDAFARLGAPAGASVSADVAAVKSDTASVKTQTDKLSFTVTNQVDANIQYVNDVLVQGTGAAGNEWGP